VVNCNLQRLDGPVRGNGKIIQELERLFRGAGWNVIKLSGAATGIPVRPRHPTGMLRSDDGNRRRRVPELQANGGALHREHFFGKYPELRDGGQPVRRRHLAPESRRPRSAQGVRRLPRGSEHARACRP
jgi:pyruvate dehydrogenase E1 component